jgi:hypothetical protein
LPLLRTLKAFLYVRISLVAIHTTLLVYSMRCTTVLVPFNHCTDVTYQHHTPTFFDVTILCVSRDFHTQYLPDGAVLSVQGVANGGAQAES